MAQPPPVVCFLGPRTGSVVMREVPSVTVSQALTGAVGRLGGGRGARCWLGVDADGNGCLGIWSGERERSFVQGPFKPFDLAAPIGDLDFCWLRDQGNIAGLN